MISEMKSIYTNSRNSTFYLFMHRNIVGVKRVLYCVVVILNLNLLMAPAHLRNILGVLHSPDSSSRPYLLAVHYTIALSSITSLGYVVITGFLAYTELPIVIREIDQLVQESKEKVAAREMKRSEFRNWQAFNTWIYALIFAVMVMLMHQANYPGTPGFHLNRIWWILVVIPWGLIAVRNFYVVPDNEPVRCFCIIMDALVLKSFLRNHIILMFFSIWGLFDSVHFSLMLLDGKFVCLFVKCAGKRTTPLLQISSTSEPPP